MARGGRSVGRPPLFSNLQPIHPITIKRILLILSCIAAVAVVAEQVIRTELEVRTKRVATPLKVITPTAQTTNLLELYKGATLMFSVPSNGIVALANGGTGSGSAAGARGALEIFTGRVTTTSNGLITNAWSEQITADWSIVLTAASVVPQGSNVARIVSSDLSAFVAFGHTNTVYNYIAVPR